MNLEKRFADGTQLMYIGMLVSTIFYGLTHAIPLIGFIGGLIGLIIAPFLVSIIADFGNIFKKDNNKNSNENNKNGR